MKLRPAIETIQRKFEGPNPIVAGQSVRHSTRISSLHAGATYHYYVRCGDAQGNVNNQDYEISFSIDGPPPANTAPTADGQSMTVSEDSPADITLTGSDPDAGDVIGFIITSLPGSGALSEGATPITTVPAALPGSILTIPPIRAIPAPTALISGSVTGRRPPVLRPWTSR